MLDALEVREAILVGFSQGGMIAQQIAVDHPDRVRAVFLACTAAAGSAAGFAAMQTRIKAMQAEGAEAAAKVALDSVFSIDFQASHPQQMAQFIRWRTAADQPALVAAMLATKDYDVRAGLPSLKMPRRVFCGGADTLTPPARVAEVAAGLGVPLQTIAGSGHMVQVEQPARFYGELDGFLLSI